MDNKEINEQVNRVLEDFASRDLLMPSPKWNESLMKRLSSTKRNSNTIPALVLLLGLILLVNVIFDASIINRRPITSHSDDNSLELVSSELLINPISAKE
jgi:uncharacterized membrane protein